jgi:hypothetical protein
LNAGGFSVVNFGAHQSATPAKTFRIDVGFLVADAGLLGQLANDAASGAADCCAG